MRTAWIFASLLACGGEKPSGGDTAATDEEPDEVTEVGATAVTPPTPTVSDTTPETTEPTPGMLLGTIPPVALAAPVFTDVVNMDVTLRSQADLLGHPTVLWFYPAAGTGG